MKMLYESCKILTQDSSTANENWLEFSFDFRMSESDKKGVENGVDAYTQNRKTKENKKEPLIFSECEVLPSRKGVYEYMNEQFISKHTKHYRKSKEN